MIWLGRVCVVIAVTACGTPAKPSIGHTAPPRSPLEEARAFERGAGVARDYRAAADVYRTACRDGEGDVEACGALLRATMRGRGVDVDRAAIGALAAKVCVARRDPFTCVVADLASTSENDLPPDVMAAVKASMTPLPTCEAGHTSACWTLLIGAGFPGSDGSSAEARRHALRHQACTLGIVEGCVELVEYNSGDDDPEVVDARQRLVVACDAGDADACEVAPGRKPIAPSALCTANDYQACAKLTCLRDASATNATSHGARVDDCERVRAPAPQL